MSQGAIHDETCVLNSDIGAILEGLNQAQLHAVTNPAPVVQILAPPGSGKTRTLTARVAYILANNGYNPSNIIVATFTVKAAREMKERIGKLVGNGLERKLILGTFHSIARRYLVRYGHLIGLKKGFGIADSGDSLAIIKRVIKRNQVGVDAASARSRISHIKAQGLSYDEYIARNEKATKKEVAAQEFVVVYREYQEGLEQANLLDYDDLLLRCVELLRAYPEVTKNVEAVLVDEFQDTNLVQFDLMRGFAKWEKRVTIVGDPDQSIYGFRAAEIKNLKRMQVAYPETLVVVLEENYRSSASILQSAQVVIEQDESRPNKMLLPTHSPGTRPVLRYLKDTAQEAQWIVLELKRVMAMTGNAITPNDVAILVRSAAQTRHIEGALAQNGIAYKMAGGLRFFDRVEVKTVLDYLRVIHNPGNNDALARVVNVPPRKVGDTTVKALLEEAFRRKKPLWEVIKGGVRGQLKLETKVLKTAEQGLSGFVNVILTARKMLFEEEKDELEGDGGLELDSVVEGVGQKATLVDIVYYLMKKLNYREYLERHYPEDHDARWANIEELVMQAADFTDTLATTLPEDDDEEALPTIDGIEQAKPAAMADALDRFLANVALVNEVREEEEEEGAAPRERVTISTIHSAKGLEWPVVFIPGCYEGSIPHSRCEDTDEERRLLYVAMTRAQGLLYMSCPKKNNKYEQSALSQFIKNPKVLKLLDKKGPTLTPATAQGVLQILGRVCPEVRVINEVAAGLESLEDDLFPIGDPSESDDEGKEWVDQGRGGKRRRIEGTDEQGGRYTSHGWENQEERRVQSKAQGWGTGVGTRTGSGSGGFMSAKTITTTATSYTSYSAAATTMSASASFSSNTTLMGGFKSARGHLDELRERQLGAEVDVTRQEMRRVHGSFGAKSTTIETTKEVFGKKTEKKVPVKVVKKGPGVGQGNLFNFFSKPSGPAAGNRGGPGKGLSSGKQQSMKSLQVKAKDGFVLLSSSPVKRRSPPPPPSRGIPSSPPPAKDGQTLGNSAVYEAFPVSGPEAPREALMMNDIIPDSDDSEDDPFDSLPPPQAPPPPQPNIPPLIPNSDPASDPTDSDAEEVYREIEALDPQSCEPVLPKPFLTRAGSGNPVLGLGAAPIRLVERGYTATERIVVPEREIAPLFNRAAVRAINQQGVSQQQQQKRTLGIRRSVNGWEARGGRGSGGGGVGGAGSGGSAGSGSRGSGKGGGSGSGSGSGKKGGGFVRHLLG